MSFGGAGPGMSILTGVAQGVVENDKRRREMEQEAIRQRLTEAQIKNTESNTDIMFQREDRARADQELRAEELAAEREREALEAQQAAEQKRAAIQQMSQIIAAEFPDMDPNEVITRATTHVEQTFTYKSPVPERPVAAPGRNISAEKWDNEQAEEADYRRLLRNPEAVAALTAARTFGDAAAISQQMGLPEVAALRVWEDTQKGIERYGSFEEMPEPMQERATSEAQLAADEFLNMALTEAGDSETADIGTILERIFDESMEFGMDQQASGQSFSDYELIKFKLIEQAIDEMIARGIPRPRDARSGTPIKDFFGGVGNVFRGAKNMVFPPSEPQTGGLRPELDALLTPGGR